MQWGKKSFSLVDHFLSLGKVPSSRSVVGNFLIRVYGHSMGQWLRRMRWWGVTFSKLMRFAAELSNGIVLLNAWWGSFSNTAGWTMKVSHLPNVYQCLHGASNWKALWGLRLYFCIQRDMRYWSASILLCDPLFSYNFLIIPPIRPLIVPHCLGMWKYFSISETDIIPVRTWHVAPRISSRLSLN